MGNQNKRRAPENDARKFRKKSSILNQEGITYIDYKDVNLLRKFMSERAKIRQRLVTGNSQKQQREVAKAIRIAREMALLPFTVRQVTSKTKKRRDGDDEGELRLEGDDDPKIKKYGERGDRGEKSNSQDRAPKKPDAIDTEAAALVEEETVASVVTTSEATVGEADIANGEAATTEEA